MMTSTKNYDSDDGVIIVDCFLKGKMYTVVGMMDMA